MISSYDVKSSTVFDGKLDHVICRVPASGYITRHHLWLESEGFENLVPPRKDNGGGIFDGEGNTLKLISLICLICLKRSLN